MNVPTMTYIGILIVLGLAGYFATGRQSITALIPAFFGVVVLILSYAVGRLAGTTALLWTMIALGVIGFVATVGGIPKVLTLIGGGEIARPAAAISQAIMAVVSLFYAISIVMTRS